MTFTASAGNNCFIIPKLYFNNCILVYLTLYIIYKIKVMFLQNWYPRETSLLFAGRQMLCSISVRKCNRTLFFPYCTTGSRIFSVLNVQNVFFRIVHYVREVTRWFLSSASKLFLITCSQPQDLNIHYIIQRGATVDILTDFTCSFLYSHETNLDNYQVILVKLSAGINNLLHNKVIPSFHMTFVSSNSNTTGITSGTGTANPFGFSGALLFNL
jgi:hypothetical protein